MIDEVTRYNYDSRDNYQGSIKDEIDQDLMGREQWVDVVHYIKAPSGHRIALNAACKSRNTVNILRGSIKICALSLNGQDA